MIFYFSATGNTQYAAQRIAQATGDKLVSIRQCMANKQYAFTLRDGEDLGIVAPTYFQGMPLFLQEFVAALQLTVEGTDHYAYAVATCGAGYGNSGSEAVRAAQKAGVRLDATYRVRMVDNWIPYFDMTDQAYVRQAEQTAEEDLAEVCAQIRARRGVYLPDCLPAGREGELAAAYDESRRTALFQVSGKCVGCGRCAAQCPVQAIELKDGRPAWVREQCLLCLGCVHTCPVNAIAYTQDTSKENKGKPLSIKIAQVGKIVTAGLTAAGAIILGEFFEKALLQLPVMAIEIPLLGSLANITGMFMASLLSGVVGAIVINKLECFVAKKESEENLNQQIKKKGEIIKTQSELIGVSAKKLSKIKENVFDGIADTHKKAAKEIGEALSNIFDEEDDDLDAENEELERMLQAYI